MSSAHVGGGTGAAPRDGVAACFRSVRVVPGIGKEMAMRRGILAGRVAAMGAAGLAVTAHASLDAFALTAAPAASTSAHSAAGPAYVCSIQAYLSGQCPPP